MRMDLSGFTAAEAGLFTDDRMALDRWMDLPAYTAKDLGN